MCVCVWLCERVNGAGRLAVPEISVPDEALLQVTVLFPRCCLPPLSVLKVTGCSCLNIEIFT